MSEQTTNDSTTEAEIKAKEAELAAVKTAEEEAASQAVEEEASSTGDESDVEKLVNERLAKMKANMDRMSKERDEALKKATEAEKLRKEEEVKRLRDAGKIQEALEMELAELKAQLSVTQEDNIKLKRDNVLSSYLSGLDFRNDRSREMAYRDIVEQLVRNEEGEWTHKDGSSIASFVDTYSKNEENSFLFKVKSNSGGGQTDKQTAADTSKQKSLKEMTTQELLAAAAKGKLGSFNV
jgi:hypothetical protein